MGHAAFGGMEREAGRARLLHTGQAFRAALVWTAEHGCPHIRATQFCQSLREFQADKFCGVFADIGYGVERLDRKPCLTARAQIKSERSSHKGLFMVANIVIAQIEISDGY